VYTAAATKKKGFTAKPFAHHKHSVTVSDGISWQVRIGLHQFDNCLSQVKISVTQLTTVFLAILKNQDIWRVLHLSAGQFPDTLSERMKQSTFLHVASPNVDCF